MQSSFRPSVFLSCWLACLVALGGWRSVQAEDQPTFRDLVRKFAKDKDGKLLAQQIGLSKKVEHVVALEYTILLATADGEKPMDPKSHKFELGDEIRIRIEPIGDAYIYIFTEGSSGQRQCLLPKTDRGEKSPFVKAGSKVVLPDDGGSIQFVPPAGTEQLLVVAAEKPTNDLTAMANVVFGKPDDQLTPAEKAIKKTLKAKVNAKLQSMRRQQSESVSYRGLLTKEALGKVAAKVEQSGSTRSVLEEPPHGKEGGTFAMIASTKKEDPTNLLVHIALTSINKKPQKP